MCRPECRGCGRRHRAGLRPRPWRPDARAERGELLLSWGWAERFGESGGVVRWSWSLHRSFSVVVVGARCRACPELGDAVRRGPACGLRAAPRPARPPPHRAGRRGSGRSPLVAAVPRADPALRARSISVPSKSNSVGSTGTSATGFAERCSLTDQVDHLPVGDRHQPRLDVGVGGQGRIGPQSRQERLGPGVISVDRADQGSAYSQHGRAVM